MRGLASFLRCRRGGAMLYTGAFGLMLMAGVGAMMTNYAWQEAQYEELRGALRASVSASSRLLSEASDAGVQAQIRKRVADFVRGLAEGLEVDQNDITITHNATTQETWVTIAGSAKYAFANLWGAGGGGGGTVQLPSVRVGVALDSSRFEIAVAADSSSSMTGYVSGSTTTRMAALRSALGVAIDVLESQNTETPGTMAAAIVPFGNVVNVADTSGSGQTEAKRRYARILTGAEVTSTEVSAAAKATTNHYYDLYASYGRSMIDMSSVISKKLPITESTPDWNLQATESVDVAALMPGAGATWSHRGQDFWNGCVMARWGAYWDADAQPSTWDSTNLDNNASEYPAKTNVAAWGTGGTALTGQPLHLSDDPPSAASPSTRFYAYSYPDSSFGGSADARMEALLKETLYDGSLTSVTATGDTDPKGVGGILGSSSTQSTNPNRPRSLLDRMRGFNDWTHTNFGGDSSVDGDALCPPSPIQPLTDSATDLRSYTSSMTHIPQHGRNSATYLHLGIVWGVRALSPLWQSVWNVADSQSAARPLAPCYGNNSVNCAQDLKKIIVILSDGEGETGYPMPGRAGRAELRTNNASTTIADIPNPWMRSNEARQYYLCVGSTGEAIQPSSPMLVTGTGGSQWETAANKTTETAFNSDSGFTGKLDTDGTFTIAAADDIAKDWVGDNTASPPIPGIVDEDASEADVSTLVQRLTPWQLFRGETATIANTTCSMADALAGKTPTGCAWAGGTLLSDGRITQRPACRPNQPFGAYGNVDDFMRVGNQDVVDGAAPFQSDSSHNLDTGYAARRATTKATLDSWFNDACDFANDRGIAIVGVFLGDSSKTQAIADLEACVDRAGGTAGTRDVHIAPTKAALETAFREIFTIRSNLRFLN